MKGLEDVLRIMGRFHHPQISRNDGQAAIDAYENTIAGKEKELGNDSLALVDPLIDLAQIRFVRREHMLARELFYRAMVIATRHRGESHPEIVRLLMNIGLLQYHSRQDDAWEWLKRAMEMSDAEHGRDDLQSMLCAHLLYGATAVVDRQPIEERILEFARSIGRGNLDALLKRRSYAGILNYLAMFHKNELADFKVAEFHYRLSLELEHDDTICANYALLLASCLNRPDDARTYYDRSMVEFNNDAVGCGNYATFTGQILDEPQRAEHLFHKALEADANSDTVLANYSAYLLAHKRLDEAREMARRSWREVNVFSSRQLSRAVFCRALCATMENQDASLYLGQLKWIFNEGVQVAPWMNKKLRQTIRETLKPPQVRLYLAIADVLSDFGSLQALLSLPLWQAIKPVNPETPWPDDGMSRVGHEATM